MTKDGSHTVAVPAIDVTYHSTHGAIQESLHVFIKEGLKHLPPGPGPVYIFEMGLGTGLNALLTLIEAGNSKQAVHYTAIELFPLEEKEINVLNYCIQLGRPELEPAFRNLHNCEWEKEIAITNYFTFRKSRVDLLDLSGHLSFNLIYFDAFSPTVQPELWTREVFEKLHKSLLPAGILVTYCSKSDVRRAMQAAGFNVKKIPGPRGKREMVRAGK